MMKLKSLLCIFCITTLLASCSKDDPEPNISEPENLTIGLLEDGELAVTVPEAMMQSDDQYAAMANSYLTVASSFAAYGSLFQVPEGATKTNQPITAANGRMAATDYVVYEWTGPDGAAMAYQYSESANQQIIEIFIKENSSSDYLKVMEVSQDIDGKKGQMTWFGEQGAAMVWTWEKDDAGNFFLTFDDGTDKFEIVSNKDKSGSIKSFEGGVLTMEISWDSLGNGSWKQYSNGAVSEQGEWTV